MWFHPDCLKKSMHRFEMKKLKAENFAGFEYLRSVDKKKLKVMCGETDEADRSGVADAKG